MARISIPENPTKGNITEARGIIRTTEQHKGKLTPGMKEDYKYARQIMINSGPLKKAPKRKGGNVKGYLVGDLINPLGPTGGPPGTPQGAGVGKGVAPQKKQNPLAAKDAELKKIALKKKEMDVAGAKPKAPAPKPGMAPPVMPQKPPRALARKGGKIKMRGGGSIAKSYSNMCVSPAYNRKK